MTTIFDRIFDLTHDIERVILDLVSATTPWLAPIIPAYMAYDNMQVVLGFPAGLALIGGLVVEFLGLAAIHTTVQFWRWNDAKQPFRAPVGVAAITGAFYLTVIITVNVILDAGRVPAVEIAAKALLSLISVAAGVVVALRAQHALRLSALATQARQAQSDKDAERRREDDHRQELERLAADERMREMELRHAERMERIRLKATQEKPPESRRKDSGEIETRRFPADWRRLSPEQKIELASMTPDDIATAAGISDRSGRDWKARLNANGFHQPTPSA